MKTPKNYKSAVEELEALKEKMSGPMSDLDLLIKDVERAEFLIQWCNERLDSIESQVVDILDGEEE
jgi:exodeoxyribonuclease VII small subunit